MLWTWDHLFQEYIHVLCDILKFFHDFSCMQVILLHKNVQYHASSEE